MRIGVATLLLVHITIGMTGRPPAARAQALCTYQTYRWNVELRRGVEFDMVQHSYDLLSDDEVDPSSGCTVCEEDQVIVDVPPLKPFQVCWQIAEDVRSALGVLARAGEPLYEVHGYRVGRTRGEPDADGNRTVFSNHSYGIALDVNPEQNGLYDQCPVFGPGCRLLRGGPWRPPRPGSHTAEGAVVRTLKEAGLLWGGEIAGNQKDFMHFSPTGY